MSKKPHKKQLDFHHSWHMVFHTNHQYIYFFLSKKRSKHDKKKMLAKKIISPTNICKHMCDLNKNQQEDCNLDQLCSSSLQNFPSVLFSFIQIKEEALILSKNYSFWWKMSTIMTKCLQTKKYWAYVILKKILWLGRFEWSSYTKQ